MYYTNDQIIATGNTVLIVVGCVDTGAFTSELATINYSLLTEGTDVTAYSARSQGAFTTLMVALHGQRSVGSFLLMTRQKKC